MSSKRDRSFGAGPGDAKRSNHGQGSAVKPCSKPRLVDDELAFELLDDEIAATRAKSKGWIKNRALSQIEYAEV